MLALQPRVDKRCLAGQSQRDAPNVATVLSIITAPGTMRGPRGFSMDWEDLYDKPKNEARFTLADLARECGVATTTISRLCRKLEFSPPLTVEQARAVIEASALKKGGVMLRKAAQSLKSSPPKES